MFERDVERLRRLLPDDDIAHFDMQARVTALLPVQALVER